MFYKDTGGVMLQKVSHFFDHLMQKYTPDPYVIAVLLTFLIFILSFITTPHGPTDLILFWGNGFWSLISFTLQMVMILVGGYIVASSEPVQKLLNSIASFAKNKTQAVILVTVVSAIACWLNWGMGLVVGAFLAQAVSRNRPECNFRILVASSYSGFLVWHGGLSASIPLLLNTDGNFSQKWIGDVIPVSETLFSGLNLSLVIGLLILLPVINVLMSKNLRPLQIQNDEVIDDDKTVSLSVTMAEKLETNTWLTLCLVVIGVGYLGVLIFNQQFSLNLNTINYLFLFLGLLLHKNFKNFIKATTQAADKIGPLLIQYPLYGALMGLMTDSGFADQISNLFISISNSTTLPVMSFFSAGIVNFFVPSGGGQWAVQAPIVIQAAQNLGVEVSKVALAVSWGDAWTNMAQPFWAVPLLTIAGLKVKDIMGFCLITLIVSGVFISTVLLLA